MRKTCPLVFPSSCLNRCTCGEMVAMSSATKKTVKPGTNKSFMCHSCGCDIGESTPYHGSGERPDRIYCHADGSDCKAKVPKREDNSSCGLCEEVSPTIYATGNMDDSSLYRCEMCFFAQRAALLDDIAAGNAEKKKKKREMDCKPSAPDTPRPHLKKARLSADGGSSPNAAGFSNDGAGSSPNTS